MRRHLAYLFVALALLVTGGVSSYAQDKIIVGGKVLNKNNGKPLEEIVQQIGPTAEILCRIVPVYNFKAGE